MKNILFYLFALIFSLGLFTSCDVKDFQNVTENNKTTLLLNPQEVTAIHIKNLNYRHNGCKYHMIIRFREYAKIATKCNNVKYSLFYVKEEDMLSNYNKIKQSMENKDAYVEIFYNFNAW
jgi:hypothetical protein